MFAFTHLLDERKRQHLTLRVEVKVKAES